jgi:hypothetical protein
LLAFYPLFAMLQGEFVHGASHTSLYDGVRFQLTRPGGGGLLDADSGTRQLISGWVHDDPVLPALGLVLSPVALAIRRLRPFALAFLVPVLAAARPDAYVPAALVVVLLPLAALMAAGVADNAWRRVTERSGGSPLRAMPGAGTILVLVALVGCLALAGPRWASADFRMMSRDDQEAGRQAVDWLDSNVDHTSTLLVDDTAWLDLVERGFDRHRTVWFYKEDLDPAVTRPWQDFDYVLESNILQGNASSLPKTQEILAHSQVVADFTDSGEHMQIRKVIKPPTGVGAG